MTKYPRPHHGMIVPANDPGSVCDRIDSSEDLNEP